METPWPNVTCPAMSRVSSLPGSGDDHLRSRCLPQPEISLENTVIHPRGIYFLFLQFLLDFVIMLPYIVDDKIALEIKLNDSGSVLDLQKIPFSPL